MDILDQYVMKLPHNQNAIDIFDGEWSSKIPGDYESGQALLLEDFRISLIRDNIDGGYKDKRILELGPLEAAHTSIMAQEAQKVIAIEANSRAYLKCLITKEILKLNRADFLLGDFDQYLDNCEKFDFVLACGVIYHCKNPVETIVKICEKTNVIGIWSHYYEESIVRGIYGDKFSYTPETIKHKGCEAKCYKHNYLEALDIPGFFGGGNESTNWMDRESWFELFDQIGFKFKVLAESLDHVHGPEFTAVAVRK
ncbi:MAG: class I SAM-dependent methyltransferase [Pseudomonadota bacterium]